MVQTSTGSAEKYKAKGTIAQNLYIINSRPKILTLYYPLLKHLITWFFFPDIPASLLIHLSCREKDNWGDTVKPK